MGHFYSEKGELRDVRIDKVRAEGLFPSVTTVLKILASEGLTRWRINQGILAAMYDPKKSEESVDDYVKRIFNDSETESKDARDLGSLVHKWIEYYFKNPQSMMDCPYKIDPRIEDAILKWVDDIFMTLHSEKVFVNKYAGCACRVDLIAILKNQGKSKAKTLIDFKTQRFDKKPNVYKEWSYQLAGNSICASGGNVDLLRWMNVVISTTVPGLIYVHEWTKAEMVRARKAFKAALTLYKIEKNL